MPRTVINLDLPDSQRHCSHCHYEDIHLIGKDITEQLDLIPAQLFVKAFHRCKYACRNCHQVTAAPMPEQPIDKGLAGAGLLAETLVNKYQEHLPLYRLEQRYHRLGIHMTRSTLCDWIMQCGQRLAPIVESMRQDMLAHSPKIHSDDTIIPILAKGKNHKGRLWVYIGGGSNTPSAVVYQYSKTRRGEVPQSFLSDYKGYLQADAYAGYDGCYQSGDIIEVGCLAHARRKFMDAIKSTQVDTVAQAAVDYIGRLYGIEKTVSAMSDIQRYYYRRRFARPILKAFYKFLKFYSQIKPPKSPVGSAISYTLNHWQAFNNYLRHGVLSIDNNIAERAMKSVVIGRKNYLFAGSHAGATHAATIYSLIETCKTLGINTFDYFYDVLTRLPTTLNKDIQSLIPYNWKPNLA